MNKASEIACITDSRGKKLGLRQPTFEQEFDIVESMGEHAANATWMGMLNPLLFVVEIDDKPVRFPQSYEEARLLIKRVGRDGYLAVLEWMKREYGGKQDEFEEQLKNG